MQNEFRYDFQKGPREIYGNYGIEGYNACNYRKYRTGWNLTRTFPNIVPKFVLQNLPNARVKTYQVLKWNEKKNSQNVTLFLPYYVYVSVSLFLFLSLSVSFDTNIQTHRHTGTCTKNIHHVQNTHAPHTTNIHARTHTYSSQTSKTLNQKLKADSLCPQNLPNFSLQVSFSGSYFTSTGQSIFSCCWRSQVRPCAAAINAPCPTGDYRHHRVSQQPSIAKKTSPSTTENASQSLQNPTRKKRNWRKNQWGASTWWSPKPAFACKHAPAHLSTRQITSVGRPRTSTPSAPHVHTNFAWFQSYSTRNLRTRSGHPPEVASQLMHPWTKSVTTAMGHIHLRGKWRPRTPRWYNAALTHTKWMDHIHQAWEWWYNGGRVPFFGKAVCILCNIFVLTYSKGSALALL